MLKPLTKDAVKAKVKLMIDLHGKTTTLEVKNDLRVSGYFATQNDVSLFMAELATDPVNEIMFEDAGGHRIYRKGSVLAGTTIIPGYGVVQNNPAHFVNIQKIVGGNTVTATKPAKVIPVGDYEVKDAIGNNVKLYQNVTRGQAKHMWCKDFGRVFFEARTLRK